MISLYIERQDAESVTLEGRKVPMADVLRFAKVGREEFATLTEEAARRHDLWEESE
jgi:hypothetical protein